MNAPPECRSGLGSEEEGVYPEWSSDSADGSLYKGVTSRLFFGHRRLEQHTVTWI